MFKYKTGDKVKVTAGKDKGREGKIEKIFPQKKLAILPGLNIYKKHVKASKTGAKGGIYDIPRPLPFSKLSVICPHCKKQSRIGFKIVDDTKLRVCKKCKREIDKK
jgi:large subunit ribosomal protein L24